MLTGFGVVFKVRRSELDSEASRDFTTATNDGASLHHPAGATYAARHRGDAVAAQSFRARHQGQFWQHMSRGQRVQGGGLFYSAMPPDAN
jgi:hypothetical protein